MSSRRCASSRGFSLVELLVVVAIIGLLASLLLPVLARGPAYARQSKCLGQLKQIGVAFHTYGSDHNGLFPMAVRTAEGGSLEAVNTRNTYRHFQALSNQLENPRILVCPADRRTSTASWSALRNPNLSYFVGVTASPTNPVSILAGDRNLNRVRTTGGGAVLINSTASWTGELHQFRGNLLLADGSAHRTTDEQLRNFLLSAAPVSP